MNPKRITQILGELRVLPMFPNDPAVMVALVRLCGAMCSDEAQVRWLVSRMTSGLYHSWPGDAEMRACLCSKFKPADGMYAKSLIYVGGIPSEAGYDPLAIEAPERKRLEPGEKPSADPTISAAFAVAAETVKLRGAGFAMPITEQEILAAPEWLRRLEGYDE